MASLWIRGAIMSNISFVIKKIILRLCLSSFTDILSLHRYNCCLLVLGIHRGEQSNNLIMRETMKPRFIVCITIRFVYIKSLSESALFLLLLLLSFFSSPLWLHILPFLHIYLPLPLKHPSLSVCTNKLLFTVNPHNMSNLFFMIAIAISFSRYYIHHMDVRWLCNS